MNIKQFINHKQKLGFVNGNDILCLNFAPFEQSAGQNCLLMMANLNDTRPAQCVIDKGSINTTRELLTINGESYSYAHIRD